MNPIEQYPPGDYQLPVIASLPHSGMWIPDHIAEQFTDHHMRTLRNTDWHLDKLYDFLPALGAHVLKANFSRYVVDPNRALAEPLFGPYQKSAVYETNTWGEPIYSRLPTARDIEQRITDYYFPYHCALSGMIEKMSRSFHKLYLLDLHSFMGPILNDVCLGDRNGQACSFELMETADTAFRNHGFDVVQNKVFRGGEIVKRYSALPQVETLQIEVRYTAYLEEGGLDDGVIPDYGSAKFNCARQKMKAVFSEMFDQLIK